MTGSQAGFGAILVAIGSLIAVASIVRRSLFHPVPLYLSSHLVALGAGTFGLLGYKMRFATDNLVVIFSFHAALVLGAVCASLVQRDSSSPRSDGASLANGTAIEYGLMAFGIAGMFLLRLRAGSWPLLADDPAEARGDFLPGRWATGLFTIAVLGLVVGIHNWGRSHGWIRLAMIGILALLISLSGNRGFLVLAAVYAIADIEVVHKRNVTLLALVGGAVLGVAFIVIGLQRGGQGMAYGLRMIDAVTMVYGYLCNGYWNLDLALTRYGITGHPLQWGIGSFAGIWYWFTDPFSVFKSLMLDTLLNESVMRFNGLNSAAYEWVFIKDFGLVGALVATFLIGSALRMTWAGARRGNAMSAMIYPCLAYHIVFSFNIFGMVEGIMTGALIGLGIYGWFAGRVPTRSRTPDEEPDAGLELLASEDGEQRS